MSRAKDLLMFFVVLFLLPVFFLRAVIAKLTGDWRALLFMGFAGLVIGEWVAGKAYEFGLTDLRPVDVVARGRWR